MQIKTSMNINSASCTACARYQWSSTIARLKAELQAHNVIWPDFVIMHGGDKTCAAALASSGVKNRGLYVVAVDPAGQQARHARVFKRRAPYYVGVTAILKRSAF